MSPRSWPQRIRDILDAIDETLRFVEGTTFEQFVRNPEKRKAVLANFAIIGEADLHIPEEVKAAHPGVARTEMRWMRNFIVHVYFAVEPQIIWDTMHNDLPPLAEQLRDLLPPEEQPGEA